MAAQHDHLLSVIRRMEDTLENTLRQLKKEQARRKDAEENLKRKIWDFQESNVRKARQVSVIQAALNRKVRECQALEEEKVVEIKVKNDALKKVEALKVLLTEKEEENVELRARLPEWDQDEEAFQVVEEMEPSLQDVSMNGIEGDLAYNQGEKLLHTTAQDVLWPQDIDVQSGEGSFLTQVTLPVENFPETAAVSDANGNMFCLSSDTVEVEIFPNILSYQEEAAADHVESKADDTNKCHQCGLEFCTHNQLMKHLKNLGHKSLTDCDACEKKFSNKYTLKAHKVRAHSSELPSFACIKCGRRFKDRERCIKHQANDALHHRLERKNQRERSELECEPQPAAAPSSCQVKPSRKGKVR